MTPKRTIPYGLGIPKFIPNTPGHFLLSTSKLCVRNASPLGGDPVGKRSPTTGYLGTAAQMQCELSTDFTGTAPNCILKD